MCLLFHSFPIGVCECSQCSKMYHRWVNIWKNSMLPLKCHLDADAVTICHHHNDIPLIISIRIIRHRVHYNVHFVWKFSWPLHKISNLSTTSKFIMIIWKITWHQRKVSLARNVRYVSYIKEQWKPIDSMSIIHKRCYSVNYVNWSKTARKLANRR